MSWTTSLGVLMALTAVPAFALEPDCSAATHTGVVCRCDARVLRPLQGAIGLEEVKDKQETIEHDPKQAWKKLDRDPIKVVHGPGDSLFITDHHHGADAWRLAGQPMVLCKIGEGPPSNDEAAFWQGLIDRRLVHLEGAEGQSISPQQLPQSLAAMPDDPYRSLAWRLRKAGGFCRSKMAQIEFAEFAWADWMRGRPELPMAQVRASSKAMLPTALALARSSAASGMQGYIGDQHADSCPDDS